MPRTALRNLALALLAAALLNPAARAEDEAPTPPNPQVVAQIEDVMITKEELALELRHQLREQLDSFDEEQRSFLERQLLQRLVERKLLLLAADREQLTPTDDQVKAFIEKMKMGLSSSGEFERELSKYKMTEKAFAAGLKEDLAIKEYLDRKVFGTLRLTDDEMRKHFLDDPQRYTAPEEVRARHILIKLSEKADEKQKSEAEAKARRVLAEVRAKPGDFPQLARKYSEADNSGKGGDLGFFSRNQMLEPFSDAAFKLKPGEISDLVKTRFGYHIIKLEERRGGEVPKFEAVRDKVESAMLRERREKLLADHLEALRKRHKVIVYYR